MSSQYPGQGGYGAPPVYPYPQAYAPLPSNGMGTASLVLGLIGLLFSFIPIIGLISWILTPLAIVFGIIGVAKARAPKGMATAGLIMGVLGLIICLIWAALFAVGMSSAANKRYGQADPITSFPVRA